MLQGLSPEQRNQRKTLAEDESQRALLKAMPAIPLVYAGTRETSADPLAHRGDVEKKDELLSPGPIAIKRLAGFLVWRRMQTKANADGVR
jgi:hypothetical protein